MFSFPARLFGTVRGRIWTGTLEFRCLGSVHDCCPAIGQFVMLLHCVATVFFALGLTGAAPSSAIGFVRQQQQHVEQVLRQPASDLRDTQLDQALKGFFDYDEIVSRAFGDTCPAAAPACEDLWSGYSDSQRAELRGLVERFVRQILPSQPRSSSRLRRDLSRCTTIGGNTLVMTEATSHVRTHDPGTHVDYLLEQTPAGPRVIDMVVAGSSLTSNYYVQFREQTHRAGGGYARIVQKLRDKIAEGDYPSRASVPCTNRVVRLVDWIAGRPEARVRPAEARVGPAEARVGPAEARVPSRGGTRRSGRGTRPSRGGTRPSRGGTRRPRQGTRPSRRGTSAAKAAPSAKAHASVPPRHASVPPKARVGPAEARVRPRDRGLGPAEARVSPVEARVRPAKARVRPAEARVGPAEARVRPRDRGLGPAEARVSPVEARVRPAKARVHPAEARVGPVKARVRPAEGRVGPVDRDLGPANRCVGPIDRYLGPANRYLGPVDRYLRPLDSPAP